MIAYVSGVVDEIAVGVPQVSRGLRNLAVLDDLKSIANLAYHAHFLVGLGFSHHLRPIDRNITLAKVDMN